MRILGRRFGVLRFQGRALRRDYDEEPFARFKSDYVFFLTKYGRIGVWLEVYAPSRNMSAKFRDA